MYIFAYISYRHRKRFPDGATRWIPVTSLLGEVLGGEGGKLLFLCLSVPSEFLLLYAYIAFILKIKCKNAL